LTTIRWRTKNAPFFQNIFGDSQKEEGGLPKQSPFRAGTSGKGWLEDVGDFEADLTPRLEERRLSVPEKAKA
jgi:hypothetical protein